MHQGQLHVRRAGQLLAGGCPDAQAIPILQRARLVEAEQGRRDAALGLADSHAPGFARFPAEAGQIIGGRGPDILLFGPYIGRRIARRGGGIAEIGRGHELALAHGAGPGTAHILRRHATRRHGQRLHQLGAEIGAATAVIGQGSQGRHDRKRAGIVAVIALDAPHRHHLLRRHAIFMAETLQFLVVQFVLPLAVGHPRGTHRMTHIFVEGHGEFGLLAVEFQHPVDRLHIRQRLIDDRLIDAIGDGFGFDAGQPFGERKVGSLRGPGQADQQNERKKEQFAHGAPCAMPRGRLATAIRPVRERGHGSSRAAGNKPIRPAHAAFG